jgi:TonB family protein
MFDFAISQNKKERLTKRLFASGIASCIAHVIGLFLLIQFPQILQGGIYHSFRMMMGVKPDAAPEELRVIANLGDPQKMYMPSAAALAKLRAALANKGSGAPPPIHIRLGNIAAALDKPPMPKIQQSAKNPDISLPPNELAPIVSTSTTPGTGNSATPAGTQGGSGAAKQETVGLPSAGVAAKPEVLASNAPPNKIPSSVIPEAPPLSDQSIQVVPDENKAIASPGNAIFGTGGYPMGEYINIIVEKIKGKWFIPSNLKNSQGHTTVLFYINKNGVAINAHIITGSGSDSLDIAALSAILSSNPFPALPKNFSGDRIGAKFVFSYNEPQ